jgi:hypothetical protein
MQLFIAVPLWLSLISCTSVIQEYEVARSLATADPGPAPPNWVPDVAIQLSKPMLSTVLTAALQPAPRFTGDFGAGVISFKPELVLDALELGAATGCSDCLQVAFGLGGNVGWTTMLGGSITPVRITGRLDFALSVEPAEGGTFAIGVAPRDIHDISVEIAGARGAIDISGPLIGWVDAAVLSALPPFVVTEVGSGSAPIRGVRVASVGDVIRVDLLTGARIPGQVPAVLPAPVDGFQVDVAVDSLLALARAQAFNTGALAMGVMGEPTKLELRSDGFLIGLRLWKTTGRGWWRDYEVGGEWTLEDGELVMTPGKVKDMGHSRGAALADPLIALAEGVIQKAIGGALDTAVPTSSGEMGEMNAEVVIDQLQAADGQLRLRGSMEIHGPKLVPYGKLK